MTWVIAHRGASHDERENTIPAFERALALGVDYIELDVQASADGMLVVFHDTTLDRLTPLTGPLRQRTLAGLAEHGVPTLSTVLELARGRAGVMAELKSPHLYRRHDLVTRTVAMLDTTTDIVVSFQRWALQEARRARPELGVLQHVGYGVSIGSAARYANAVGFANERLTHRGLAKARSLGLTTTVYTVNEPKRMRELVALGVDGIFTDRPELLAQVVRPQHQD